MSRVRWAATIGLATGIAGVVCALLLFVEDLERSVARQALFLARGDVAPPRGVALVSIDEAAATRMGLPAAVRDWPRSTHARLVEQLVARGASAIAFDIQFFRHGDADADQVFAAAIDGSRRVVLVRRVDAGRTSGVDHWQWQEPIPLLAEQAIGLAPVPMPDVPVVSWAWSFLSVPNAGEVPTLPTVMLQVKALPVLAEMLDTLARLGVSIPADLPKSAADIHGPADLHRVMAVLRHEMGTRRASISTDVADRVRRGSLSVDDGHLLLALVDVYGGSDVRHLNFYGPPGRICTIPYDVVLGEGSSLTCDLNGAIVFVGLGASRIARSGQEDTYHAVYPASNGVDFSGVEIHATVLANLIDGSTLRSADGGALGGMLLGVGGVLGAATYWIRTRRRWTKGATRCRLQAAAVAVALSIVYVYVVYAAFREYYLVLPVVVPLLVQLPVAVVLGLVAPPAPHREEVRAVCLATDAGGSTALGQHMPHGSYARLMDEYLQMLLSTVRANGGEPVPPEGDGLVCVWHLPSDSGSTGEEAIRLRACRAALEIVRDAQAFNLQHAPDRQLPTRIGLNAGVVTICSDADRGVFEVFGDTINVAARLRDLNRELSTSVLASGEVVVELDAKLTLNHIHDAVPLKGVFRPLAIFQVVGLSHTADPSKTPSFGT